VSEDGEGGRFYVVGQKIVPTVHSRQGAGYEEQADDGAGAAAEGDGGPIAGPACRSAGPIRTWMK